MNSAPYKATQAQREGSSALASFEEMGQLERDVIEWLFVENRFLRKLLAAQRHPIGAKVVKIGFDIGGVLSKYPDVLRPVVAALAAAPDIEVHVLSDMHPHEKCVDWVVIRNGFAVLPERIHSCDYPLHGEECKAVKAREIGLDVLVDDFPGYVATLGAPALRLLSMPDPTRDYYHETWNTDGSEGNFGRRLKV